MTAQSTRPLNLPGRGAVSIRAAGTGPVPVVLLHGYSMSLDVWSRVLDDCPPAWAAHAYSLRGFGDSTRAPRYGGAMHVEDLRVLLDVLGLDRAVLVGHSMGANLLQDFATTYPARLRALVLSNAAARNLPPPDPLTAGVAARLARYGTIAANREVLAGRYCDYFDARNVSAADLDRFVDIAARSDTNALRDMLAFSYTEPAIPASAFAHIDVPVMLIASDEDRVTPPAAMRELARVIAHARLAVMAGCGHTPMWEAPALWRGLVADFLAGVA